MPSFITIMKQKSILDNRIIACALAILCTMLWGTAFPFIKLGYSALSIADGDIGSMLLFAGFRFTLAGLMVFVALCISGRRLPTLGKGDIAPVAALGLVQTTAQYLFTYIGIGFTSGTHTSIITACASFFTVLAAPLFFRSDKLTALKLVGCVLGFSGVLAVNWGGKGFGFDMLFGDCMILLSTVSAAAGNFVSKKIASGRNPVKVTAFQLILGGLVLIAAGFACNGRLEFKNIQSVLILLWLAFVSAAAFSIWTALLKHHPASVISIFNLLVPVFGTLLSGLVLGEDVFRTETLISLVLISLGIAAVNLSGTFKRKYGEKL